MLLVFIMAPPAPPATPGHVIRADAGNSQKGLGLAGFRFEKASRPRRPPDLGLCPGSFAGRTSVLAGWVNDRSRYNPRRCRAPVVDCVLTLWRPGHKAPGKATVSAGRAALICL